MAIYDVFPFFNELDILEIRLNSLYEVVDYFLITEATTTFSGNSKKLFLTENLEQFEKFKDKIEDREFLKTFTFKRQKIN